MGCFNIHASLLPRWRGAAPIQRALLAGDTITGVSIMRMEAGLDTGPVSWSRAIAVGSLRYGGQRCTIGWRRSAPSSFARLSMPRGRPRPGTCRSPQTGVTYAEKIDKAEALIDWREDAAQFCAAYAPSIRRRSPKRVCTARSCASGRPRLAPSAPAAAACAPSRATVLEADAQGIDVACGRGVLRILRLQLAGRKPWPPTNSSARSRLTGARFESP